MLLCRTEPSNLGASDAPAAPSASSSASVTDLSKGDPVADVLDWLGHFDWRSDDDEIPAEEASGSRSRATSKEEVVVQRPRKATTSGSLSVPAAKGPGRLLGSTPSAPSGRGPPAPASRSSAAAVAAAAPAAATGSSGGAAAGGAASAGGAAAGGPQPPAHASKAPLPKKPLEGCANGERGRLEGGACCQSEDRTAREFFFEEEEEEEWEQRQRKSGTVGRLVVYHEGESPKEDVVLRGGGSRRHVVVAGVREGGQAARVGVRAGDRLVSINGKKDFLGLSADAVRERLEPPCILVFLGFVGKLQAEVRLTCTDNVCGISTRQEVVRGSNTAPVRLCEERVFDAGIASLFLTVGGTDLETDDETGQPHLFPPRHQIFELQRSEACGLVKRALRKLEPMTLLSKAALPRAVGAQADGSPQSLVVGPPSPQPAQVPGRPSVKVPNPAASGAPLEPPPPPPMQPSRADSAATPADMAAREDSGNSNAAALWEAESADALARALFREDAAALAMGAEDAAAASARARQDATTLDSREFSDAPLVFLASA